MITGSGKPLLFANAGNKARLKALGIQERQVKEARISQEHTAKERATLGRPSTRNRPKKQQKKDKDTLSIRSMSENREGESSRLSPF